MARLGRFLPGHRPSAFVWVLAMLVVLDAAFIELHRLYLQGAVNERFSLQSEQSIPEQYQHTKELLTAFAGAWLLFTRADLVYACWTGLFGYLWVDDRFQLHEHFGTWFTRTWPMPLAGIPAQALGEMILAALAGGVFVVALTYAWPRSRDVARQRSVLLVAALVGLAVAGVAVDVVHAIVRGDPWRYRLGIVEEGGEMVMVSVLTWIVVAEALTEVRLPRRAGRAVVR